MTEGLEKEAFKSAEAAGNGNKGAKGGRSYTGAPLGRRNAKGLWTHSLGCPMGDMRWGRGFCPATGGAGSGCNR